MKHQPVIGNSFGIQSCQAQPASSSLAAGPVLWVINKACVIKNVAVPEWMKNLFVGYDKKKK